MLTQFTKPTILETIGQNRIAKFLDEFFHDLAIAKVRVPSPESQNGHYFQAIADVFADPLSLPEPFLLTVLTLEKAALPANQNQLDAIIN